MENFENENVPIFSTKRNVELYEEYFPLLVVKKAFEVDSNIILFFFHFFSFFIICPIDINAELREKRIRWYLANVMKHGINGLEMDYVHFSCFTRQRRKIVGYYDRLYTLKRCITFCEGIAQSKFPEFRSSFRKHATLHRKRHHITIEKIRNHLIANEIDNERKLKKTYLKYRW